MEERGKRKTGEKEEEPHTQGERLTSPSLPMQAFRPLSSKAKADSGLFGFGERERECKKEGGPTYSYVGGMDPFFHAALSRNSDPNRG